MTAATTCQYPGCDRPLRTGKKYCSRVHASKANNRGQALYPDLMVKFKQREAAAGRATP